MEKEELIFLRKQSIADRDKIERLQVYLTFALIVAFTLFAYPTLHQEGTSSADVERECDTRGCQSY
jgi:hypothetical protein